MKHEQQTGWTATDSDRRNQRLIVPWSLAWALSFLAVAYGIEADWIGGGAPAVVATIGVTILGLATLFAFRRFLGGTDELMRKIQLDALALTVGVGLVAALSYSLMESAGIVAEADVLSLVLIMILTYIVGVVAGQRKYR